MTFVTPGEKHFFEIRTATREEWPEAERIAAEAFADYESAHPRWVVALRESRPMARLAASAEVIVAVSGGVIVGACGYMAPGVPRHDFFPGEWSILRMMSVPPRHRGRGIARALVHECVRRAKRDGARVLGLYTSPIMKAAVPLYVSMGFKPLRELPDEMGVPCVIYTLDLAAGPQ